MTTLSDPSLLALPSPPPTSPKPLPPEPLPAPPGKPPQLVFPNLYAFAPNRDTLGGTAYWLQTEAGNGLVDCPPWHEGVQEFLRERGGVRWLLLTHRTAIAKVGAIQAALGCEVVVQEQEAYLLPGLAVTTFREGLQLTADLELIWTCGHSPGSACVYWAAHGGVLFTGRHLLPTGQGMAPLRTAKTFHWPRQLRSVAQLRDRFSPETLRYLCPGASIGLLRGRHYWDQGYAALHLGGVEGCTQEPHLTVGDHMHGDGL